MFIFFVEWLMQEFSETSILKGCIIKYVLIMTEWVGWTGKCMARGHGIIGPSTARSMLHDQELIFLLFSHLARPYSVNKYIFYHAITVRIFTATKLSQITSRGAILVILAGPDGFFSALLAPSHTVLVLLLKARMELLKVQVISIINNNDLFSVFSFGVTQQLLWKES